MKSARASNQEEWVHSACAMSTAAPMKVRVKNGKIVEVKGEDIPGYDGKLCGKAIAGIAGRIYAPDRILYPLKRVGERGEAKFVRCTWEEVIDAVAKKLKEYIDAGHPEYFEIWWGCPVQTDNIFFLHYWAAVLRAGISYMHGQVCFGDHQAEKVITFGSNHGRYIARGEADWLRTKYAVIAGQNLPGNASGGGGGCRVNSYSVLEKAKRNGCKFVAVDPKLADSTPWCDEWLPIRPGTDAIFALSVASVIVKEKLYDEQFLLKYSNAPQLIRVDNGQALKDKEGHYLVWDDEANLARPLPKADEKGNAALGLGRAFVVPLDGEKIQCKTAFQILVEEVKNYPAEITELPEKTVEIARNLGKYKPAVVFYPGFTSGRYPNWFQAIRAYSVVNLLLGNLDKPGGIYIIKNRFAFAEREVKIGVGWPQPPEVPDYLGDEEFVPGPQANVMSIRSIDRAPCYTEPREFHPDTLALPFLHFEAMEQGKVRAVLSTAENAAVTQPDSKWVWECLKKLDLIIVGEQLPKEFVDLADYVLPEASYLERYHLYGFSSIGPDDKEHAVAYMRSAVIPPQGVSKPLSWFLTEVAKRIGLGEYFEKLDLEYAWWDRVLKNAGLYPKVTARKLVEEGPYVEDYPMTYNLLHKPINTRSGRFEIYSNELSEECYHNPKSRWHQNEHVNPIPRHVLIAEPKGDNQFYLISGKASWHQKSATQNNRYLMEDAIEGGCPYTPVYINTDRAKKLGIEDGDLVQVECVGPTKKDDPCVYNEAAVGVKETARAKLTEGLHPDSAWIYFAAGHRSKLMLSKAREGISHNWFLPCTVSPYVAGTGKNYSIVRIYKIN